MVSEPQAGVDVTRTVPEAVPGTAFDPSLSCLAPPVPGTAFDPRTAR
jgi:hypothetical protein